MTVVSVDQFYEIRNEMRRNKLLADPKKAQDRFMEVAPAFSILCTFWGAPAVVRFRFNFSKDVHQVRVPPNSDLRAVTGQLAKHWGTVQEFYQRDMKGIRPAAPTMRVTDLKSPLIVYLSSIRIYVKVNGRNLGFCQFLMEKKLDDGLNDSGLWKGVGLQGMPPCIIKDIASNFLVNTRKSVRELLSDRSLSVKGIDVLTRDPLPMRYVMVPCMVKSVSEISVRIDLNNQNSTRGVLKDVAKHFGNMRQMDWIKEHGALWVNKKRITEKTFWFTNGILSVTNLNQETVTLAYIPVSGGKEKRITCDVDGSLTAEALKAYVAKGVDSAHLRLLSVFDGDTDEVIDEALTIRELVSVGVTQFVIRPSIMINILVEIQNCDGNVLRSTKRSYPSETIIANIGQQLAERIPDDCLIKYQRRYLVHKNQKFAECDYQKSLGDVGFQDNDTLIVMIAKNTAISAPTTGADLSSIRIEDYNLDISHWTKGPELGHGSYGRVLSFSTEDGEKRAVKEVPEDVFQEDELRILLALRDNPCIVTTYGYCHIERDGAKFIGIVMDEMMYSLDKLIQSRSKPSSLSPTEEYKVILGIAYGMRYLHAKGITYRDLKPSNVMLDQFYNPFLTDFGTAKILRADTMMMTGVGTPYYMAPEILGDGAYDSKVDVFSFACVLYEMLTGGHLHEARTPFAYARAIMKGSRPEIPAEIEHRPLGDLLQRCWDGDPEVRPTFNEIVECLKDPDFFFDESIDSTVIESYIESIEESAD